MSKRKGKKKCKPPPDKFASKFSPFTYLLELATPFCPSHKVTQLDRHSSATQSYLRSIQPAKPCIGLVETSCFRHWSSILSTSPRHRNSTIHCTRQLFFRSSSTTHLFITNCPFGLLLPNFLDTLTTFLTVLLISHVCASYNIVGTIACRYKLLFAFYTHFTTTQLVL